MTCSGVVSSVAPCSPPTSTPGSKRVPNVVGRRSVRCTAVSPAGNGDVYCLTVPDVGAFLLANGAVVSNCADELRYMCMARPWTRVKPPKKEGPAPWTMDWIEQQDAKRKKGAA